MSQHTIMGARFLGPRQMATILMSEEGGVGAVRIDPPDTLCELTTPNGSQFCENSYTQGDVVTLTAIPAGQSGSLGWTGHTCMGTTDPCQVTMSEHRVMGARFLGPRRLATIVMSEENGFGAVRIDPPDALCEVAPPNGSQFCEHSYTQGDVVTLTAIPTGQSVFLGWTDPPCMGTTDPCQVTLDRKSA